MLYRGRSAQKFRDPGFLEIVSPENDAIYLPLKKGRNELMLAVSELGGGWGFVCRLAEPESSSPWSAPREPNPQPRLRVSPRFVTSAPSAPC